MACIIRMSSDVFLDKFIDKHDYRKFNFLLISEDIKTTKQYKNVYAIPSLIPPPNMISTFISEGYGENYIKKYLDYIATPRVEAMITIMVKLCVVDNSNVILLCSKAEDEFKYLDVICQYIEYTYGLKTYTYKKYKDNPEECENIPEKSKKKISKLLESKIGDIKDIEEPKVDKKTFESKMKKLNRKEMKKILQSKGVKFDSKLSKKELRKLMMANIFPYVKK